MKIVFEMNETTLETQVAGKVKIVSGESAGTVTVLSENFG
jgi:hypothetical protein